jgi:cytochrome P450
MSGSGVGEVPAGFEVFDVMGQFTDTVAGDVRDPYPALWAKRAETPVERAEGYADETYVVYRYEDVARVLRDNVTFTSQAIRDLMGDFMGPFVLVGMDEPEHRRHRNLVAQAFRNKSLAHWETDFVVGTMHELIDRFAGRGHAELVREFTFRFPVMIIARILGVPPHEHEQFHEWAVSIVNAAADPDRGFAASAAMREYLAVIVEQRRADPQDDVISDLVTADLDGERLDDEEIYSFLRLLLPAGAETTYRASGNFLYALLTQPDQRDALRADSTLLPQAVEESIRWESPLLITSRTCAADTEIAGVPIPAGTQVVAHVGSANHDDSRWDRPDDYDLLRDHIPHISFGVGPHMCLGMHLARMELRSAVTTLFDRLPDIRLDPDGDDPHIHGELFRSPTSLPVVFSAA